MCATLFLSSKNEFPVKDTRPLPLKDGKVVDDWFVYSEPLNSTPISLIDANLGVKLSGPYLTMVGAYTGCSCGFDISCLDGEDYYWDLDEYEDSREKQARLTSKRTLSEFCREHEVDAMFACWSDHEQLPALETREIKYSMLQDDRFVICERVIYHFR